VLVKLSSNAGYERQLIDSTRTRQVSVITPAHAGAYSTLLQRTVSCQSLHRQVKSSYSCISIPNPPSLCSCFIVELFSGHRLLPDPLLLLRLRAIPFLLISSLTLRMPMITQVTHQCIRLSLLIAQSTYGVIELAYCWARPRVIGLCVSVYQ
jgi:hypothetical protein